MQSFNIYYYIVKNKLLRKEVSGKDANDCQREFLQRYNLKKTNILKIVKKDTP